MGNDGNKFGNMKLQKQWEMILRSAIVGWGRSGGVRLKGSTVVFLDLSLQPQRQSVTGSSTGGKTEPVESNHQAARVKAGKGMFAVKKLAGPP